MLCATGYKLDLLDRWEGAQPEDIVVLDISLDEVSEAEFRMFENHRFRLNRTCQPAPQARLAKTASSFRDSVRCKRPG